MTILVHQQVSILTLRIELGLHCCLQLSPSISRQTFSWNKRYHPYLLPSTDSTFFLLQVFAFLESMKQETAILLLVKLRSYGMFYTNFRKILAEKWWLNGSASKYNVPRVIIITNIQIQVTESVIIFLIFRTFTL